MGPLGDPFFGQAAVSRADWDFDASDVAYGSGF